MEQQPSAVTPAASRGGLAAAIERGKLARRQWTLDGTLLSQKTFAARRDMAPDALVALEAQGRVFSLEIDGVRWYPAELLRMDAGDAEALCAALAELEPTVKLGFLMRRHGALAGMTAASSIAEGGINRVLALASAWRSEAAL